MFHEIFITTLTHYYSSRGLTTTRTPLKTWYSRISSSKPSIFISQAEAPRDRNCRIAFVTAISLLPFHRFQRRNQIPNPIQAGTRLPI